MQNIDDGGSLCRAPMEQESAKHIQDKTWTSLTATLSSPLNLQTIFPLCVDVGLLFTPISY